MIARQEQFYRSNPQISSTVPGLEVGDTCVVDSSPSCATEEGPFVPYHTEEGAFVLCWGCHGYLVGPPGRRLCRCQDPGPISSAESEKLSSLRALRDALAECYRRRWFKVLLQHMDGADEGEARAAWSSLLRPARERAARKVAKRGPA